MTSETVAVVLRKLFPFRSSAGVIAKINICARCRVNGKNEEKISKFHLTLAVM